MPFVLDASVALAWYFRDETSDYANRTLIRLDTDVAVVPPIWPLEVANGLLIAERRGRLNAVDVSRARGSIVDLSVRIEDLNARAALDSVFNLARGEYLSIYDASYLDVAMRNLLPLATVDARLQAAATRVGIALVE